MQTNKWICLKPRCVSCGFFSGFCGILVLGIMIWRRLRAEGQSRSWECREGSVCALCGPNGTVGSVGTAGWAGGWGVFAAFIALCWLEVGTVTSAYPGVSSHRGKPAVLHTVRTQSLCGPLGSAVSGNKQRCAVRRMGLIIGVGQESVLFRCGSKEML